MLTPQDLIELRKIMIGTHLLTSGQFDKELAKIDEATKRLDDKNKSILSVADAEKVLRDADRQAYETRIKLAAEEKAFKEKCAAHDKKVATFEEDRAAFLKRKEADTTAIVEHERKRKAEQQQITTDLAKAAAETARVAAATDSLNERSLALAKREAALNERIEQMKALAV
jgi:hypothetical protein